ncbi:hypothetical protein ABTX61_39670 [Amycolatopsis japonica]|uniref:hypothetical protein n=1 Tax=Amycolatopsis japonica TaxID=208439 RepID=UPI003332E640
MTFIASRPELASLVRTVTDGRLVAGRRKDVVLPDEALALFIVTKGTERLLFGEYQRQATLSKGTSFRKAAVTGGDGRYLTTVDYTVAITDTTARIQWLTKTLADVEFTPVSPVAPDALTIQEIRAQIARLNSEIGNRHAEYLQAIQHAYVLKEELRQVERELAVALAAARTPGADSEYLRAKTVAKRTSVTEAKRDADNEVTEASERLSAAIRQRIERRAKLHELETLRRRAMHAAEERQLTLPPVITTQSTTAAANAKVKALADELLQLRGRLAALRADYIEKTQRYMGHQVAPGLIVDVSDPGLRQAAPAEVVYLGELGEPVRFLASKRSKALYDALVAQGSPVSDAEHYAAELYALSMRAKAARRSDVLGPVILIHRISAPQYHALAGPVPSYAQVGNVWITEVTVRISMIGLPGTSPEGVQHAWERVAEALELINAGYLLPGGSVFRLQVDGGAPDPELVFTAGDMPGWSVGQHVGSSTTKEEVARQLLDVLGVTVTPGRPFALEPGHCEQLAQTVLMTSKSVSPVLLSGTPRRTERRPDLVLEARPADPDAEQMQLEAFVSDLARQVRLLHARNRAMPEVRIVIAEAGRAEMQRLLEEAVQNRLSDLAIARPITFVATETEVELPQGEALCFVEWDPEGTRVSSARLPIGEGTAAEQWVSASAMQDVPGLMSRERMKVLDNEQVWRYSEATADHDDAAWSKLENPLHPWDWERYRKHAHVVTVDQSKYVPLVRIHERTGEGGVETYGGPIAYDLRRICVNGHWVQEYTVRLHLSGCTSAQQAMLARRAQRGLDALFNYRYRLPSGDQLHVRVEIVDFAPDCHAVIEVVGTGGADQLTWPLDATQTMLAHEVGHYLGIEDQYRTVSTGFISAPGTDRDPILRKHQVIRPADSGKTKTREDASLRSLVHDDHGLYTQLQVEPVVMPRDIWRIEFVARGYAAVRDSVVDPGAGGLDAMDTDSTGFSDQDSVLEYDSEQLSAVELDGLIGSMLRVAAYLDGGAGIWLADPSTDVRTLQLQEMVVQGLPVDDALFTVIAHAGPAGTPEFLGQQVTSEVMAALLTRMYRDGTWAGHKSLRFVSCGLGVAAAGDYIRNVLRLINLKTGIAPAALAPDALVWATPNLSGQGASHDLIVASQLGYDGYGSPVISNDGHWLYFECNENSGEVDNSGRYNGYMIVGQNALLKFDLAPAGYHLTDKLTAQAAIMSLNASSMPFGEVDGYEGRVVVECVVDFDAKSAVLTSLMDDRVREVVEAVAERVLSGRKLLVQVVGQAGNNPVSSSAMRRGRERVAVVENRVEELLAGAAVGDGVTVTSSVVDGSGRGVLDRRDASVFRKRRSVVLSVVELDSSDDGVSVAEVGVAGISAEGVAEGPVVTFEEEYLVDDGDSVVGYGSWGELVVDLDGAVVGDGAGERVGDPSSRPSPGKKGVGVSDVGTDVRDERSHLIDFVANSVPFNPAVTVGIEGAGELLVSANPVIKLELGEEVVYRLDDAGQVVVLRDGALPTVTPRDEFVAGVDNAVKGYLSGTQSAAEEELFGGPLVDSKDVLPVALGGRTFQVATADLYELAMQVGLTPDPSRELEVGLTAWHMVELLNELGGGSQPERLTAMRIAVDLVRLAGGVPDGEVVTLDMVQDVLCSLRFGEDRDELEDAWYLSSLVSDNESAVTLEQLHQVKELADLARARTGNPVYEPGTFDEIKETVGRVRATGQSEPAVALTATAESADVVPAGDDTQPHPGEESNEKATEHSAIDSVAATENVQVNGTLDYELIREDGAEAPFTSYGASGVLASSEGFPSTLPMLQRSEPDHPLMMFSADGTIGLPTAPNSRFREFYATEQRIEEAKAQLKELGSKVSLKENPANKVRFGDQTLVMVKVELASNPDVALELAHTAIGGRLEKAVLRLADGAAAVGRLRYPAQPISFFGTHEVADALVKTAELGTAVDAEAVVSAMAQAAVDGPLPGEQYGRALRTGTEQRSRVDAAAKQLGVNQFAWPSVGEAYLIQGVAVPGPDAGQDYSKNFARIDNEIIDPVRGNQFGSVVAAAEDDLSHIVVETDHGKREYDELLDSAINENLQRHAADLDAEIDKLKKLIALSEPTVDVDELEASIRKANPKNLTSNEQLLVLALALRDLRDSENTMVRRVAARKALAAVAGAQLPALGDYWQLSLYGRGDGKTFFDKWGRVDRPELPPKVSNPVVLATTSVDDRAEYQIMFDGSGSSGSEKLHDLQGEGRLRALAKVVAKTALWRHRNNLPMLPVIMEGYGDAAQTGIDVSNSGAVGTLLAQAFANAGAIGLGNASVELGFKRARAAETRFREILADVLDEIQADGRKVTLEELKIAIRLISRGAEPLPSGDPDESRRQVRVIMSGSNG